jgi:hypothetical protein
MSHRHPQAHPLRITPLASSPKSRTLFPASPFDIRRPKKCAVCINPAKSPSIYCQRCRAIVYSTHHERRHRKLAAIPDYDPTIDGFRCHLTKVMLDLTDPKNPWYRSFCERIPAQRADQIVVRAEPQRYFYYRSPNADRQRFFVSFGSYTGFFFSISA